MISYHFLMLHRSKQNQSNNKKIERNHDKMKLLLLCIQHTRATFCKRSTKLIQNGIWPVGSKRWTSLFSVGYQYLSLPPTINRIQCVWLKGSLPLKYTPVFSVCVFPSYSRRWLRVYKAWTREWHPDLS